MIQSALLGGVFIGVLSALPIINIANCCCLWITGGGLIAGYILQQYDPRPLTTGRGALAGLLAGAIGAVVWLIAATALDIVIAPLQERLVDEMVRSANDMPPEVRQWLDLLASRASSPFRLIAGFMFQLMAGAIFATAGGAMAGAWLRKPPPPHLSGNAVPPPLPPQ